jgi:predicted acetyltransferase
MAEFIFNDYEKLTDGEIELVIREKRPAVAEKGLVPSYEFDICLPEKKVVGRISLRVGDTERLRMYGGHIGEVQGQSLRGKGVQAGEAGCARP